MKKQVFAVLLASVAASSVMLVHCNNGTCDYVSKCINDPKPTQDDITTCNNKKNDDKCGGLFNDYLACIQSNQTCTSTGVTDNNITNGLCGDPYGKWEDCYYGLNGSGYDAGDQ